MPWLRSGDTAAEHPVVLSVLELADADDRLLNEAFGFVVRCALQSAAHLTDSVISRGTAIQMAGYSRADVLIDVAVRAGYFSEVKTSDGKPAYKLIEDDKFLHMRTKEEIEFERQRKNDNSNPDITVPVRLRDGDACRYCGLVVNFHGDRRSQKGGTYDHLTREVKTPDDMVVACMRCNSALGDAPRQVRTPQLMPPPPKPYFKPKTREFLANHEFVLTHGITIPGEPEPDRRAGTLPPGRDRGTPASRAEQTPPTDGRTAGLTDSQSERDPATITHPEGSGDSQSQRDLPEPVRTAGLTDSQSERDPANSGADKNAVQHPADGNDRLEASRGHPPRDAPDQAKPSQIRFQQVPAGPEGTKSRYAGTGRDGSGLGRDGPGRVWSGRDGPGLVGSGRQRAPVGGLRGVSKKKKRRR